MNLYFKYIKVEKQGEAFSSILVSQYEKTNMVISPYSILVTQPIDKLVIEGNGSSSITAIKAGDDYFSESGRYELHDGVFLEKQPDGKEEEIGGFLAKKLMVESDRLNLPYFIPHRVLVHSSRRATAFHHPDVLILNENAKREPRWNCSVVTNYFSISLVIEIVSTNWRDDYYSKRQDYEEMGIAEYWIVDYLGLGGKSFIGSPKQPTLSVFHLADEKEEEYEMKQFRGDDRIDSPTFPELSLTAQQVFNAGA